MAWEAPPEPPWAGSAGLLPNFHTRPTKTCWGSGHRPARQSHAGRALPLGTWAAPSDCLRTGPPPSDCPGAGGTPCCLAPGGLSPPCPPSRARHHLVQGTRPGAAGSAKATGQEGGAGQSHPGRGCWAGRIGGLGPGAHPQSELDQTWALPSGPSRSSPWSGRRWSSAGTLGASCEAAEVLASPTLHLDPPHCCLGWGEERMAQPRPCRLSKSKFLPRTPPFLGAHLPPRPTALARGSARRVWGPGQVDFSPPGWHEGWHPAVLPSILAGLPLPGFPPREPEQWAHGWQWGEAPWSPHQQGGSSPGTLLSGP